LLGSSKPRRHAGRQNNSRRRFFPYHEQPFWYTFEHGHLFTLTAKEPPPWDNISLLTELYCYIKLFLTVKSFFWYVIGVVKKMLRHVVSRGHPVSSWIALKLHFVPRLRGNDNRGVFTYRIIILTNTMVADFDIDINAKK
jgi:hypothetical protein